MCIHFIRHTTPEIESGICYGQADIDVSKSFKQEAKRITGKLKQQQNQGQYEHIFSSPAKRCLLLAEEIQQIQKHNSAAKNKAIIIDDKLQEFDFGDWELRHWDDIPREQSQAWTDDYIHMSPPNGETLLQMQRRVEGFIAEIPTHNEPIAVITHAGIMRLIASHYLNIPLTNIFNLKVSFGQIIELNSIKNSYSLRFLD